MCITMQGLDNVLRLERKLEYVVLLVMTQPQYRGADKSLARPGRKQATATDDFEFRMSYL